MKKLTNYPACLLISVLLFTTACFDFDFPDFSGLGGGYGGSYNYPDYDYYITEATFHLDSTIQQSNNSITIYGSIHYNGMLVLTKQEFNYAEPNRSGGPLKNIPLLTEPDSINFMELPDRMLDWTGEYVHVYKYAIEVDDLKVNRNYTFCISTNYIENSHELSVKQCIELTLQ